MEKYSRVVGGGILFYFLLLSSVSNAQVTITTQPTDVTVCLTESTTATFTCVVDRGSTSITIAGWHILEGETFISITGRDRHMSDHSVTGNTVTDTLTVTDVSVNDSGVLYRCEPFGNVFSNNATLTVLDPPAITTVEVTGRCTNDITLSWTAASNVEGLSYTVSIVSDEISEDVMDTSYNITGLTPGTTYIISVLTRLTTALLAPCLGFSKIITNTTLTVEAGVPQRVQYFNISTTATAIIIEWDSPDSPSDCGPVFYYIVTIDSGNAMKTSEARVEFSDLINGTIYNISVAAVNRAGTGPALSMNVTGNVEAPSDGNSNDDDSGGGTNIGAILGPILGAILVIIIIAGIVFFIWRYYRNKNNSKDTSVPSNSPESLESGKVVDSSKLVHSKKHFAKEAKPNKKKKTSKPQEAEQKATSEGVEYAALQHDSSGTSRPPPTVDHTKKVAYVEVKEHEPLAYAQVQHEAGSENKPIQGAPQVEYKEVWHQ